MITGKNNVFGGSQQIAVQPHRIEKEYEDIVDKLLRKVTAKSNRNLHFRLQFQSGCASRATWQDVRLQNS